MMYVVGERSVFTNDVIILSRRGFDKYDAAIVGVGAFTHAPSQKGAV